MPIARKSLMQILAEGGGRVDWAKVDATTDEEIARQAAEDPDTAAPWTEEEFARARLVRPSRPLDVRAIRSRLGLSQKAFAQRFGFGERRVRAWESGRAIPERSARILLRMIEVAPETVERAAERV